MRGANALATDIQRFLSNEPIAAGPPTAVYRFKKFVQRNRGPLLVASLVTTVLLTGLLTYSRSKWLQYQSQLKARGDIEQAISIAAFCVHKWRLRSGRSKIVRSPKPS